MRRPSPPPSQERERVIFLLKQIRANWREVYDLCVKDVPQKLELFPAALVIEDSNKMNHAIDEILTSLGEPWSRLE